MLTIVALVLTDMPAATQDGGCGLEPLSLPLFDATPVAIVVATPDLVADAPPMDEAAVTDAMDMIVACANDADPAVAYAIFTDRYLASEFLDPAEAYLPAFELMLAQEPGAVEGTLELRSIDAWEVLPDGRVLVEATFANDTSSFTDTFVLAFVGDAWLIDEVTSLDPAP